MGHDEIVRLIKTVLPSNNEQQDGSNKKGKKMPKERMKTNVLNLLSLFWTPVKDENMIEIEEIDPKNLISDKAFQKEITVMYFVKHLYSLLFTINQEKISLDEYRSISNSIQKLQEQISAYNSKYKIRGTINREDISGLYKKMIESNSDLPKIQLKLFEDIKEGILDLIISENKNEDQKYQDKNQKIMISFAILHAMNSKQNDNNDRFDYIKIFKEVKESEILWSQDSPEKCDLKTLKFVFDQMLGREGAKRTKQVIDTIESKWADTIGYAT